MSMILDGSNGVTFNDSSLQGAAASPYGLKNKLINGDMRIDQRNAGASVTNAAAETYTLDRWAIYGSQASKFTIQQNAGSVTPPSGFTKYVGVTSSSAYSVLSTDQFLLYQAIEGLNCTDLDFGASTAKTLTLSFWVRSSLTGTFSIGVTNYAANRSYVSNYTISAANTWEQKTITITGDTSGSWLTTNSGWGYVNFNLGCGSNFQATNNTWSAGNYKATSTSQSVVGTSGATFYVTGVQLEIGSTATPFERRMYGQELLLCQRYYEKSYNINAAPATAQNEGQRVSAGNTGTTTTGEITVSCEFNTRKRTAPTMVMYDAVGNSGKCTRTNIGVGNYDNSAIDVVLISETNAYVYSNTGSAACFIRYHFTASAEL